MEPKVKCKYFGANTHEIMEPFLEPDGANGARVANLICGAKLKLQLFGANGAKGEFGVEEGNGRNAYRLYIQYGNIKEVS